MKYVRIALLASLSAIASYSQSKREPQWLPALAYGSAPDCPEHPGLREARTATALSTRGALKVYIDGSATRSKDYSCRQDTTLIIAESDKRRKVRIQSVRRTKADAARDDLDAPNPIRSYTVVDFSPDGRFILLERTGTDSWRNDTFRDVDIAVLDVGAPSQPKWVNTWDLMHWDDCNATVETQGFDNAGKPVLRVRPSVWHQKQKRDCVTRPELWAVDLERTTTTRLPNETILARDGKTTGADWQTCKGDPDIVAACFDFHGRLSAYNGTPSLRMWRVGTNRMLGVLSETAPENVSRLFGPKFDLEIYSDFEVFPFTKQKPGEMQMVCIESAAHLFAKQR